MDNDTHAPSPLPPGNPGPSRDRSTRGAPLWLTLVPVLCLAVTAGLWWQTTTELATVRADQREILDAIRGVSSLDIAGAPAVGPDDAVVTLVEFSDYECPFCIRHFALTMPEIMEKYIRPGRIRYVFKDFPIAQLHPEALRGHEAAKCANEEGRFWEMHGRMFSPAGSHTMEQLEAHAIAIGVPIDRFRECMASGRHTEAIQASIETASRLGANGTPSFFVGLRDPATDQVRLVQTISGAHPFSEFEKVIDAALAEAAATR